MFEITPVLKPEAVAGLGARCNIAPREFCLEYSITIGKRRELGCALARMWVDEFLSLMLSVLMKRLRKSAGMPFRSGTRPCAGPLIRCLALGVFGYYSSDRTSV